MSSPRSWIAAPLGALLLACAPEPAQTAAPPPAMPASPTPASAAATPAAPPETCLLGPLQPHVQQRMIQDNGLTALLEDQQVGDVSIVFAAQKQALGARPAVARPGAPVDPPVPPAPQSGLLLARGTMVTEALEDIEYVPREGGGKPTETRTTTKQYTYFLADAAWDCEAVAAEIDALALPKGQVSPGACVKAELRARCRDVTGTSPAAAGN